MTSPTGPWGAHRFLQAATAVTARVADDEAWLSERYGARGLVQEQLERVQDLVTDLLTSASPPTSLHEAVRDAPSTRFLLIAAGEVPEEAQTLRFLESAAADRVRTWTVDGAGHTDGLSRAPDEWEERVISFLTQELQPSL